MWNRRQFIGCAGSTALMLLAKNSQAADRVPDGSGEFLFLEAEAFDDLGGWVVDQQSMDQMGSPYLLAHGLGIPVTDATTHVRFPSPGSYRIWVRTRDWVAPWKVPGAPGRFQVLIDGQPIQEIFGTKSADWHWHDGGMVTVASTAFVSLHDLTGFEGRCDAILFSKAPSFEPSNNLNVLTDFRRRLLGLSDQPEQMGSFDLVVVGGGIAGTCAALSATRQGLKVGLVQDRPVLGGNGSAEVRVWPEGKTNLEPFPHLGDIVNEIVPSGHPGNGKNGSFYGDEERLKVVRAEPGIKLFLEHRVIDVEVNNGSLQAVVAENIRTGVRIRLTSTLFADCTGDATLGFRGGADYEVTPKNHQGMSNLWNVMDVANKDQILHCECKDKTALCTAYDVGNTAQPFPRCPWAIDLTDKPFPGRKDYKGQWGGKPLDNLGSWFWESGFDLDPVADVERIRDLNLRAMYGAWDALKNIDKLYPNHRLGWSAFIAGKRESRRLLGDVIVSADDFTKGTVYKDACFPCTWHIDIHTPEKQYDSGTDENSFISHATTGGYKGPYWVPYRCLYSRNISNLFMAGRDISVTHEGLGPVRVMKTCGMMGEVVGKAASICIHERTNPRGVYENYLDKLKDLLQHPGSNRKT